MRLKVIKLSFSCKKSMKKNELFFKSCIFSILFFNIFLILSCVSKPIPIPGESKILIENIYFEYLNIADKYFELEDYNNAAKYYKLAMENKNLYWQSYYKLAKTYALLSDWKNALPMFEKLLERDKDNHSIKASLAYIYSMQGDTKKAIEIYKKLLEEDSLNEKYLENYLAVLLSSKDSFLENQEEIEKIYEQIETNFPNNTNLKIFDNTKTKYLEEIKSENPDETEKDITNKNENKEITIKDEESNDLTEDIIK